LLLTSSAYFVFLALLFFLYWPARRWRLTWLSLILFANLFCYAKWELWYLAILPAAAMADFAIALGLERWRSRWLLGLSLAINLGLLGAFKFVPSFPLQVGVSFYVFQALSYTIDVYRGDAKAARSPLSYLAAVTFFPVALSGPITRPADLMPQLERVRSLDPVNGGRALFLMGLGMAKKFLIADYLGENLVNRVFDFPNLYSGLETMTAIYAYALQLYYDFSGYTDIAIGSGMLLGVTLPANFNAPYMARTLADFWRRWHISLSNWLRDYLYFSFPGLRGRVMPYVALFLTMVAGGFWHGNTINFVIWGALHGAGLAIVRAWQQYRSREIPSFPAGLLTFHFVCFAWVFFRSPTLDTALAILSRVTSLTIATANISFPLVVVLTVAILGHFVPKDLFERARDLFASRPFYEQAAALMLLMIGLQYVAATGAAPFIYTRF
jgi:alginate O-acetyltransferase complex protein AlgI